VLVAGPIKSTVLIEKVSQLACCWAKGQRWLEPGLPMSRAPTQV
jgi:hypothetical protein